jgi:penicillin-binding protein 1A
MPQRKALTKRRAAQAMGSAAWPRRLWGAFWAWTGQKGFFARWGLRGLFFAFSAFLLVWAAFELYFGSMARGYDLDYLDKMPERSVVLDATGQEMGRLHGENRLRVPLAEISPYFLKALLAREDTRFYDHGGVDWRGVLRAVVRNFSDNKRTQGASTLTMQLARNSFPIGRAKTLRRKLLEIALTRRIEANKSKEEILELYCNRIFFGQDFYGVERASRAYFAKSARDLTLDEAALLAGIIRGPSRFSPWAHTADAMAERDTVLDRMVATGQISAGDAAAAQAYPTKVAPKPSKPAQANYLMDMVRSELETLLDMDDVDLGGLKIYTTFDPHLQKSAEGITVRQLRSLEADGANNPLQSAVVLLETQTGAVRAVVGGRSYALGEFNHATAANRPAGSTFKPIVYAAAVQHAGLYATAPVSDAEIRLDEIRSAERPFSPANSDDTFTGVQPAQFGLVKSRNTMTVRVGEMAGIDHVHRMAEQLGIPGIKDRGAQVYLGNVPVSPWALTSAISTFANGGNRCRPYIIDRIETPDGEIIFRSGIMAYEAIPLGVAYTVGEMLRKVCGPAGTASSIAEYGLRSPVMGKTGTTDGYHDAWFIGCTPKHTCGVWIGRDKPAPIGPQAYGGRVAVPIWGQIMQEIERRCLPAEKHLLEKQSFPKCEEMTLYLCPVTRKQAKPGCLGQKVLIPADCVPGEMCPGHGR